MSLTALTRPATAHAVPARPLVQRLLASLYLLRSRRALARLSPTQLDDIGLTKAQAETEAKRPFWDAPQHWLS